MSTFVDETGSDITLIFLNTHDGLEHSGCTYSEHNCKWNSLTSARSTDGGATFTYISSPDSALYKPPFVYTNGYVREGKRFVSLTVYISLYGPVGVKAVVSNIVRHPYGEFYYMAVGVHDGGMRNTMTSNMSI